MVCRTCASEQEFVDGRCAACGTAAPVAEAPVPSVRCPKCRAGVEQGEKFCGACGAKIPTRADRIRAANRSRERQETQQHVNRGRRWMLIVAVLTILGGVLTYFTEMGKVEKTLKEAEDSFRGLTPAERDAQCKDELGMTWAEVVDHDRGLVRFQMVILVGLGVIFLGLWWWAQTNPFAAALIALLLFVTSILVGGLVEPASIVKGIFIKGIVIVALFSAVSAGYKQRSQQRRRAA